MAKLTVRELDVRGKRVFVRVDYNVPMEEKNGQMAINDVTRIKETLPTLELLIEKGARIILAAHLGRPNGKREMSMSLRPVAARLADMIHRPIAFVDDCIGEKVEKTADALKKATFCCWKMFVTTTKKKRTIPPSRKSWRRLWTFT